jgi:hypothetical protein
MTLRNEFSMHTKRRVGNRPESHCGDKNNGVNEAAAAGDPHTLK